MRYDYRVLPDIMAMLALEYGYVGHPFSIYDKEEIKDDIHIYPAHFFDGPKYHSMAEVVCIHHCMSAWRESNWIGRRSVVKKDFSYYIHKMISDFLKSRGVFMKMYYVGFLRE